METKQEFKPQKHFILKVSKFCDTCNHTLYAIFENDIRIGLINHNGKKFSNKNILNTNGKETAIYSNLKGSIV